MALSSGSAMVAGALFVVARARQVRPADDADELAVADDRHALDLLRLEQHGDIGEFGRVADRDDIARHDVPDRSAVRLDIVAGELAIGRDPVEPP